MHAALFGLLAATTRARFGRGLLVVLLCAPASELLQTLGPVGRDGGWRDALADVCGALVGWWAVRRLGLHARCD